MKRGFEGAVAAAFLLVLSAAAGAQSLRPTPRPITRPAAPGAAAPAPAGLPTPARLTEADVEAFLDGLLPAQLAREDIAGAVVVVVRDGKVLFGRGYGWADVAKRKPVSVDGTLFRPGSTSKLFTWTSVMQQVERGKLDLDRDVNQYLDFKIPEAFGKPITLRDLMTHTPGFEDVVKDLFVAKPGELKPLKEYLPAHLPRRIFPPGTTPAYSNLGTAIAGYVVERVSGRPFADYVEENILRPLGMRRSTFRQPLPADLAPSMSNGYRLASGEPQPFELVNPAPAGAMSATGSDMARFMIAHLQDGRFENAQILRPETARLMHARQRGKVATMNAMCLGFYEESRNGIRIIGHAGDTNSFHTDLHLIPEANVGFFISYNSAGRADFSPRDLVWSRFLDRYFPFEPPAAAPVGTAAADARTVAGSYVSSRRGERSFLRLLYLLTETVVSPRPDHTIQVDGLKGFDGKPKRWREIGPLTYREVGGQELLAFQRDAAGRLEMIVSYPFFVFPRASGLTDRAVLFPVAIGTVVLLLLTVLLWPVAGLVRRHYRKPLMLEPRQRRLRLAARLVCAIDVLLIVLLGVVLALGFQDITLFSAGLDPLLRVVQVLVLIGVAGAAIALVNAVMAWTGRGRGVWSRIGETLIALGCLGFVWLALAGHLYRVGPSY